MSETDPDLAAIVRGLTKAQRDALHRCTPSGLGAVNPATDQDAKTLHFAGLAWTQNHWWRQLNNTGLAVRAHLTRSPETNDG